MIQNSLDTLNKGLDVYQRAVTTLDKYTLASFTVFLLFVVYTLNSWNLEKGKQIVEMNELLRDERYSCDSERIANYKIYYATLNKLEHDRDSLRYFIKYKFKK